VASVQAMAGELGVSEATLRRDLRNLETQGLLQRTRGGAVVREGIAHEPTYVEKRSESLREKQAIARAAFDLVATGDSILIGPGTTTLELAHQLRSLSDLTVVTNSLLVIEALIDVPGIDVIVTGGALRHSTRALVGPGVIESLHRLRVSQVFISGNGLNAARGLTTPDMHVAATDRGLVAAGEQVVVLADHTKIGRETMCQTIELPDIDILVTDGGATQESLDDLRVHGMEIVVADDTPFEGDGGAPT
jgi:DeoR/GlpR family transcriptional regulator of sugar metabolism